MVLVDTSVWVRFLMGRAPYVAEMDRLLGTDEIVGHQLVYGELLIGDRSDRTTLLASYSQMYQAAVIPHDDLVTFVRSRKLYGRGVGWIDIHLVASALVERFTFWTADRRLAAIAAELGIAHQALP